HKKHPLRGGIGQGFGGAALFFEGIPGRLDVEPREQAAFANTEAGDRIVAAISREQKPPIERENDAACAFEGVRRAVLATDWLERPGPAAAGADTFHLGERAISITTIVDNGILDLIGLHVEGSATRAHARWTLV